MYDFIREQAAMADPYGHGTHVASIITEPLSDGCVPVELLIARILDKSGRGNPDAAGIIRVRNLTPGPHSVTLPGPIGGSSLAVDLLPGATFTLRIMRMNDGRANIA